ncbi:MAG: ureidoglycolate dehydrogenase [Paenibacillus sp.]|nr:ureidoglycolate dehydrogenase [Paenibacillus sp.]
MTQIEVSARQLADKCIEKLVRVGVKEPDAAFVADVLVHADLRGVESHGTMRLEHYVKTIECGGIVPNPDIRITAVGPSIIVVDGGHGLGHVIAGKAMEAAVRLAGQSGVAIVSVTNSSHCGALSFYVNMAAACGMIGMMMTNTDKLVTPFGGAQPYFGTNPLAYAIPAGRHKPIILDMATSTVAYGKILHALENNKRIPLDWAVNGGGEPTDNPGEVAALLPFGGAKGYGLGMMVDVFSGILTGSPFGPHIPAMYGDCSEKRGLGHFMLVMDPSRLMPIEQFHSRVDQMIDELHALRPAPGFAAVQLPGEPEERLEAYRLEHGIPLSASVYRYLFAQ